MKNFVTVLLLVLVPGAPLWGAALGAGSLWGGGGEDGLRDLVIAPDGSLYGVGFTETEDGGFDAWLLHWDDAGNLLCQAREVISGSGDDAALAVAVSADGSVYVVGTTDSPDLDVKGAAEDVLIQSSLGADPHTASDAFLARLDDQCQVVFLTYFGGAGAESGRDVALFDSPSGTRIYLLTSSDSEVVQGTGGYRDQPAGGGDILLARFNERGERLYFTFLGGSGADWAAALAVDPDSGDVALVGHTASSGLAADQAGVWDGAYQAGTCAFNRRDPAAERHPCYDIVVARFDATLSQLRFLTYLGGAEDDYPSDVVFDTAGDLVIAGSTLSPGAVVGSAQEAPDFFPLSEVPADGAGDSESLDAFVLVLAGDGSGLRWSRLLRGADNEFYNAVALGPGGEIYLAGHAWSEDLPWVAPLQTAVAGGEGRVTALDGQGRVVLDTLLGGVANDYFYAVVGDGAGRLWLAGGSRSSNPGGTVAGEPAGASDGWLVSLDLDDDRRAGLRLSGALSSMETAPGESVEWWLTVVNEGTVSVPAVRVFVTLPSGVEAALPAGCVAEGVALVCALGDLAVGERRELGLILTARRGGDLRLRASVASALGSEALEGRRVSAVLQSRPPSERGGVGWLALTVALALWWGRSRWRPLGSV